MALKKHVDKKKKMVQSNRKTRIGDNEKLAHLYTS